MNDTVGEGAATPFVDVDEPGRFLRDPGEPAEFHDPFAPLKALSLSGEVLWFLKHALHVDPLEKVQRVFAGDWKGFARCAEAMDNLAAMSAAIGANVRNGNQALDFFWDGQAADAAHMYFGDLSFAVAHQRVALHGLSEVYRRVAHSAWSISQAVKGVIAGLIDKAIIGAAAALAGGPIGWGIAAAQVVAIIHDFHRLERLLGSAYAVAHLVTGVVDQALAANGELSRVALPETAYRHPVLM